MIQNKIQDLLEPVVVDLGYVLWGCEYLAQGRHALLRIYIDKDTGIGIEDCERVSRQVSALLDVEDPISGNYSLEISSPGIPRPLFKSEQYNRYIGQVVEIRLFKPMDGQRKFQGKVISADDNTLILACNVEHDEERKAFVFSNITKGFVKE